MISIINSQFHVTLTDESEDAAVERKEVRQAPSQKQLREERSAALMAPSV